MLQNSSISGFYFCFQKTLTNALKSDTIILPKEVLSMAIRLTKEALEYYILTCLCIQELSETQLFKSVSENISINSATFYALLVEMEGEGKIAKKQTVQNGVLYELCTITSSGKDYLDTFLKTR